ILSRLWFFGVGRQCGIGELVRRGLVGVGGSSLIRRATVFFWYLRFSGIAAFFTSLRDAPAAVRACTGTA
ncbi:MAG: hypothetical protein HN650_06295, partial [Rhodospirillaceae bacterium]|nr:hypothetical protein [Rhodospirillaceae bacterium]